MADIEKLEERYEKLKKELIAEKRKAHTKLVKQIGSSVIKTTKVKKLDEFENDWELVNKNPKPEQEAQKDVKKDEDSKIDQSLFDDAPAIPSVNDSDEPFTQKQKDELVEFADKLKSTGDHWKIENAQKLFEWLSQFRTDQSNNDSK